MSENVLLNDIQLLRRELRERDEGLLRAFHLLTEAMKRQQTLLEEIHLAATRPAPPDRIGPLMDELRALFEHKP